MLEEWTTLGSGSFLFMQTPAQLPATPSSRWKMLGLLAGAVVFALSYTQAPLFYSNQHQYFLHGLAHGGLGFLSDDWLANTTDPTPLFSGLVAFTYRHLSEYLFYGYYAVLLGIYFWSQVGLFGVLTGPRDTPALRLGFITAFLIVHAALVRLLCSWLAGLDYVWYAQAGLAGQYVLGPVLQPSTFGVLLLLSLTVFLQGRPFLAVVCAAAAAVCHTTYLWQAGLLILAYLVLLTRDGQGRRALGLAAVALVLVLPVVSFQLYRFAPTSAALFAQAQHLLVHERIPHHTVLRRWWDATSTGQLVWMLAALVLARGTRLGFILLWLFGASAAVSLLQVATDNDSLALVFPWRTSVILVPIATTVILSRLLLALAPWLERQTDRRRTWLGVGCITLLVLLAGSGLVIQERGLGYRRNDEEQELLDYVRTHKTRGDVYLIPVELPKPPLFNGSPMSIRFGRVSRPASGGHIPVDMQQFRLFTGAALFSDFKSIPYRDVEFLEWHQRLLDILRWYERIRLGQVEGLPEEWTAHGITHVVTRANQDLSDPQLQLVHADRFYKIYRIKKTGAGREPAPSSAIIATNHSPAGR